MKKNFTIIVIFLLSAGLLGCQKQEDETTSIYFEKLKTEAVEPVEKSESNEETLSEEYNDLKYENGNIIFKYPDIWEIKEAQHEDGKEISLWNQSGEKVIWIKTGEAWRANLEMDDKAYMDLLMDTYDEVEILDLLKSNIGGYEASMLIFAYDSAGRKDTIKRYTVIVGYAFFEINISSVLSDEEVGSFINSLEFTEN